MIELAQKRGVGAETGGGVTLFLAAGPGLLVSTTRAMSGAVVDAAWRVSALRGNIAKDAVMASLIARPTAALIAGVFCALAGFVE